MKRGRSGEEWEGREEEKKERTDVWMSALASGERPGDHVALKRRSGEVFGVHRGTRPGLFVLGRGCGGLAGDTPLPEPISDQEEEEEEKGCNLQEKLKKKNRVAIE